MSKNFKYFVEFHLLSSQLPGRPRAKIVEIIENKPGVAVCGVGTLQARGDRLCVYGI